MNFEDKIGKKPSLSKRVGYFGMYAVFTIVLYFMLQVLNKLPTGWTLFHIAGITLAIVLLGRAIRLGLE